MASNKIAISLLLAALLAFAAVSSSAARRLEESTETETETAPAEEEEEEQHPAAVFPEIPVPEHELPPLLEGVHLPPFPEVDLPPKPEIPGVNIPDFHFPEPEETKP